MRSVALPVSVAAIAPDACPELALAVELYRERCRRDHVLPSPAFESAAEVIDNVGAAWIEGQQRHSVPFGSDEVPTVDSSTRVPLHWLSVRHVAQHLEISERAVVKQVAVGTLTGRKDRGAWHIDPASLPTKEAA